jgi:hypothetical protein
MIYLAVRLAKNSTTATSGFAEQEVSEQIWLHPSEDCDAEDRTGAHDDAFDDTRVRWFRSPKVSYVLRDP